MREHGEWTRLTSWGCAHFCSRYVSLDWPVAFGGGLAEGSLDWKVHVSEAELVFLKGGLIFLLVQFDMTHSCQCPMLLANAT